MREIPSFRGTDLLRRAEHDEVAFVTLTRFDSAAGIRAFAGGDHETPVLEPQALGLLSRLRAANTPLRYGDVRSLTPRELLWRIASRPTDANGGASSVPRLLARSTGHR